MRKPLEVVVENGMVHFGYDVWFVDRRNGNKPQVASINPDGYMVWTEINIGDNRPHPTLTIDEDCVLELIAAFTERGVKPPEAGKINGLLEAQSRHLEDMRKIVGKKLSVDLATSEGK